MDKRVNSSSLQRAAWLALAVAALSLARAADAQIYVYKDAYGRSFFTDAPPHDGYEPYHSKAYLNRIRTPAGRAV